MHLKDDLEAVGTHDLVVELKKRYELINMPERRLVFVGPPGSGKGTLSASVKSDLGLCHLSTGDMLREAVQQNTALGAQAKDKLDRGELVSDDIVLGLIDEKLSTGRCRMGFVLDGFPRNLNQANALSDLLKKNEMSLDHVVYFETPDECLKERICGRRVHLESGRVYHTSYRPPKVSGIDDVTGDPLIHRKDDTEEVLRKRLETFRKETLPLIDYYSELGLLYKLDASQASDEVRKQLYRVLDPPSNTSSKSTAAPS